MTRHGITGAILLLVIAYTAHNEVTAHRNAQTEIDLHARVIGEPLWNGDRESPKAYLAETIKEDLYESLVIVGADGAVFYSGKGHPLNCIADRCLARLGLIPLFPFRADVTHDGKVIGRIEADVRIKTIYRDLYVVVLGFLLALVAHLYLNLLQANRDLGSKVLERTAKLQMSEKQFAAFMANLPGVAFLKDEAGRLLFVNRYVEKLFGLKHWEGKTSPELFAGEQGRQLAESDPKALVQGPLEVEQILTDRHGVAHIFETVKFPIRMEGGAMLLGGVAWDITRRRQAEKAVRESEEDFRSLIESAPDAIFVQSQGRLVYLNPAMLKLLGASKPEELLGTDFMERVAPEFHEAVHDRSRFRRMTGMPTPLMEQEYLRLDGSRVSVETTAVAIRYQGHNANLVFVRDITMRKRMEESLRVNERRLSLAISATADAVWEWNVKTGQTYFSPRWYEMLGYTHEQFPMTFDTWMSLCHLEDVQPTMDKFQGPFAALRSHGYRAEFRMRHKDGSWRWILGRGNVVERDTTGQPVLMSGTNTDITERKQVEEALRRSEEKYYGLFENAVEGIYQTTPDGAILFVNPAFAAMCGYANAEELIVEVPDIGKHLYVDPERRAVFKRLMAEQGKVTGFECQLRRRDGEVIWASVNGRVARDSDGKIHHYDGTLEDITERKRFEAELLREKALSDTVINSLPNIFYMFDQQGRLLRWNDEFARLAGITSAPPEARRLLDYIVDEDKDMARAAAELVYAEGRASAEVSITTADGIRCYHCVGRRLQIGEQVYVVGSGYDVTERKRAETILRENEKRFRNLANATFEGIVITENGRITDANDQGLEMLGCKREEILGRPLVEMFAPESRAFVARAIQTNDESTYVQQWLRKDGTVFDGEVRPRMVRWDNRLLRISAFRDITEREQTELYRTLSSEVLEILNQPADFQDTIQRVLAVVKERTACDAAGIRLQNGEDFPYFVQDGFSSDFLCAEHALVARDPQGSPCRGPDGRVDFEGTCGQVISGKTDPSNPFFTPGGSAWTNDAFPLLKLPAGADPRLHPRNRCIHEGYASLSLVPIRAKQQIVGLLQLTDRRKNRFTLATIQALEGISFHIGEALMRRQAEGAVRENVLLLRQVIDLVPHHIFAKDRHGRYLFLNRATAEACGRQPQEMVGRLECELRSDTAHVEKFLRDDQEVIASGTTMSILEEPITYADGRIHFLQTTKMPFTPPGSAEQGVLGVAVDITERKRAEEALRESKTLFDQLAEQSRTVIWEVNSEGLYTHVSHVAKEAWGYQPEELVGRKHFYDLHPDEGREAFKTATFAVFERKNPFKDLENPIQHKDGSIVWVSTEGIPLLNDDNTLRGYRGSDTDITEHKRAETLLRENEERFRNLASATFEGIFFAENGRILDGNEQGFKMFGYKREEILGKSVLEFVAPECRALVAEAIRTNDESTYEHQCLRKDGTVFDGEARPRTVRLGNRVLRITALRDITERKRAEEELQFRNILLSTQQDVSIDGILVVDDNARILSYNRRFVELWGLPPKLVEERADEPVLEFVKKQMADPELFFQRVQYMYEHKQETGRDALVLADGRVFDRYSAPMFGPGNHYYGRVWTFRDISEHKQAEQRLQASEERYRGLVNTMTDIIYMVSPDCRIIFIGPQVQRYGFTVAELLHRSFEVLVHPEDLATMMRDFRHTLTTGEERSSTFRVAIKDGSIVWFEGVGLPFRDNAGNIVGISGMLRDITARKRAEEALREAEAKYRTMFENAMDGIYRASADGTFLAVNPAVARILGCSSAEEVLAYANTAKQPWQVTRAAKKEFQRRLQSQGVVEGFEYEVRRKDGSTRWLSEKAQATRDADGTVRFYEGVVRDITEHKRANEERTRLTAAIEQAAETIVITDAQGKIVYANPAFEKTSGHSVAEALGKNPNILRSGKQDAEFYRRMWETLTRGEVWHGHFINKRKDGTLYEEEATISPVRDASGRIVNFIALKLDVTREAQLEHQLRQAQKMEAIGQLAGGVAHDFNNILTAFMMSLSGLQRKQDLDADIREGLQDLETGATRASTLTRQLLMFSRRSVLNVRKLDLNDVVADMLKMLGHLLGEHIDINFEPTDKPPLVKADAGMMEQVLMNLAVNARDAMPKGGQITIAVEAVAINRAQAVAHPERRVGHFICLSVADTGCGMDEATQKRIFEPFFTTKALGKGTGLGLATVYGIVAQHRGWVEVQSQPGQGATFRVFLPAIASSSAAKESEKPQRIPTGHETLLLVEDEPDLRQNLAHTLRVWGYRVLEAANGRQALAFWESHAPEIDLLLTDVVMPEGMMGLELAEKLRAEKPHLKVIISSGYSAEMAAQGINSSAGMVHLPKPYSAAVLGRTVRDCLDGKQKLM